MMVKTQRFSDFVFTYRQFRQITGLSKKEADLWTQQGLIRSELSPSGRRRHYTAESVLDGVLAKQLADFSSRTLLSIMMQAFHRFLAQQKLHLGNIPANPAGPRLRVQFYTMKSEELMPGGGIRGVVPYVKRFEPDSVMTEKSVFLIVDLTQMVHEVFYAITHPVE
jgi:hypothetical protein